MASVEPAPQLQNDPPAASSVPEASLSNGLVETTAVAPSQKKPRTRLIPGKAGENNVRPPCYLDRMPLEILAEILLYAPSPAVVLALARCSKFFCHTLVNNPSTTFIWRNARKRCARNLPEPTANFTEASYAAFVFDYGKCEICGAYTRSMYKSYSLRARLCSRVLCKDTWDQGRLVALTTDENSRLKDIKSWIPCMERTHPFERVRKRDWQDAVDEYNRALLEPDTLQEFLAKKRLLAKKIAAVHTLSKQLTHFRDEWQSLLFVTKQNNEALAGRIASREGWTAHELIGTRTYGLLHRSKTAVLEKITYNDYMLIRDQVDQEMVEHRARVARREAEAAFKKRRDDVAAHYTRLKSEPNPVEVLPTLSEFRKLSVMKVMQGKASDKDAGVGKELKSNKLVNELLTDNLNRWREEARSALAGVLGFPGWKSASKKKVHPVDRLTARFICKKCSSKGKGGEGLTFTEVCGHRCVGMNKKQRAREAWSSSLFEPDVKAIDAVNTILGVIGTTAEDLKAPHNVGLVQSRLLCTACPAPISMTFEMAVHHSKRHEHPAFEIASENDARLQPYGPCPLQAGLAARLLTGTPEERRKKRFACRHCQQAVREAASTERRANALIRSAIAGALDEETSPNPAAVPASDDGSAPQEDNRSPSTATQPTDVAAAAPAADAAGAPGSEAPEASEKRAARRAARMTKHPAFNFDGLKSHLKEKHGILHIGDEDIAISPTLA